MKKITSTLIVLILLCSHAYAQSGDTFKSWGEDTFSAIKRDLAISGTNLYREKMAAQNIAFNWPQGVQLHALIAAKKTAEARALADEMHQKYWCNLNGRWGYNSSANACGDRYYDDNAWIAKALMELYTLTNDVTYLNRAKDVIAFSMSGENHAGDTPNGGIRWHEGDPGQCMCATAPTTVTNLQIYQATGDTKYLTDGTRLYNWMKSTGFNLGPGNRGYENAVQTQAALRMFQITGDATYYNDAKHLGLAMETVYIDWNTHALHETGQWGGHDMSAAYVELYNQDKDINWLNIAAGYLSFLHTNDKDVAGRYPEDWSLVGGPASDGLLFQASAARAFALLGNTPGGSIKYPEPVAIFKECSYAASYSAGLRLGKYTTADLSFLGMPDKAISSVKVQPGYKVTFYTGDNFTGNSLVKTADTSCLVADGFNDNISSLIVEAITPGVEIYKDCNYSPRAIHLPVGNYDMFAMNARGIANDDISSLKVSAGYEIEVYQNYNFTGDSYVLSGDDTCLVDNGLNDWISSIKVRAKNPVSSSSSSSKATSSSSLSSSKSSSASSLKSSSISSTASSASGACAGIAQYVNGSTYATGAVVKNVGNKYRCDVGGWCTIGGPYEPGVGWAWTNAWTQTGTCQ